MNQFCIKTEVFIWCQWLRVLQIKLKSVFLLISFHKKEKPKYTVYGEENFLVRLENQQKGHIIQVALMVVIINFIECLHNTMFPKMYWQCINVTWTRSSRSWISICIAQSLFSSSCRSDSSLKVYQGVFNQ